MRTSPSAFVFLAVALAMATPVVVHADPPPPPAATQTTDPPPNSTLVASTTRPNLALPASYAATLLPEHQADERKPINLKSAACISAFVFGGLTIGSTALNLGAGAETNNRIDTCLGPHGCSQDYANGLKTFNVVTLAALGVAIASGVATVISGGVCIAQNRNR